MSKNKSRTERFCKECGRRKFFQHFCLWCFKMTNSDVKIFISEAITSRETMKLRKYKDGVKKFCVEIISGWFPTKGKLANKLPYGVEKYRVIDREKNEYHEIVKDYKTNKIIHECHEPLEKHRK